MKRMMSIIQAAVSVGVNKRTIKRWEAAGKVAKAKRDYKGWRVYGQDDVEGLIAFHDKVVENG